MSEKKFFKKGDRAFCPYLLTIGLAGEVTVCQWQKNPKTQKVEYIFPKNSGYMTKNGTVNFSSQRELHDKCHVIASKELYPATKEGFYSWFNKNPAMVLVVLKILFVDRLSFLR